MNQTFGLLQGPASLAGMGIVLGKSELGPPDLLIEAAHAGHIETKTERFKHAASLACHLVGRRFRSRLFAWQG